MTKEEAANKIIRILATCPDDFVGDTVGATALLSPGDNRD